MCTDQVRPAKHRLALSLPSHEGGLLKFGVAALALGPVLAHAFCDDAKSGRPPAPLQPAMSVASASQIEAGKVELRSLVDTALRVSAEARAAEHNRQAADFDLTQTKASALPQVVAQATTGVGEYKSRGIDYGFGGQGSANLTLSGPLYDGGRNAAQVKYREQLLAASGSGLTSKQEQVVHDALMAVLDRQRLQQQFSVHEEHLVKLTCLAGLVERVVNADKGRSSELFQARTSLYQAQVARDELQSALRQSESKVKRLLGEVPADWRNLVFPLRELPPLDAALQAVKDSPEVRQLQQQAEAQARLVEAVAAEAAPQLKYQLGFNAVRPADYINYRSWNFGLTLNYTLVDNGVNQAARGAARERMLAARQGVEQMLADRSKDVSVSYEAAESAQRRAARLADVIVDSEKLRNATYAQWSQLGNRSLFDLISAESEHRQLGLMHANAVFDALVATTQVRTASGGMLPWVAPDLAKVSLGGAVAPRGTALSQPLGTNQVVEEKLAEVKTAEPAKP